MKRLKDYDQNKVFSEVNFFQSSLRICIKKKKSGVECWIERVVKEVEDLPRNFLLNNWLPMLSENLAIEIVAKNIG